jgi:hypothetical protein
MSDIVVPLRDHQLTEQKGKNPFIPSFILSAENYNVFISGMITIQYFSPQLLKWNMQCDLFAFCY